jgi:HTH-type transcriptional regulator / antitoxin HigA
MATRNEYLPQSVSHPGETLIEKLIEMGMSQKEFAVRTHKPEQTIVKVINGESSITPDMAVQFENVLKIPAHFWLNRQQNYDIAVARIKLQEVVAAAASWANCFPYKKMAQAGWVTTTQLLHEKTEQLFAFFGISSHQSWEDMYIKQELKVAFRISLAHTNEAHAVSAWLRQGEIQAQKIAVSPYDAKKFKINLIAIKSIMAEHPNDFFQRLQELCLEAGVKVIYTPCLPNAPIHGSTRWLGDTPLIQLSARYKRNDIFWFTFFHEVGHILLHGKKYISLEKIEYSDYDTVKEQEADDFAVDWTFPKDQEQKALDAAPLTEENIVEFAKQFNTHPAMIIGRFHRTKRLHYSIGRNFLEPINLEELV